jgi:hypothetical protein
MSYQTGITYLPAGRVFDRGGGFNQNGPTTGVIGATPVGLLFDNFTINATGIVVGAAAIIGVILILRA